MNHQELEKRISQTIQELGYVDGEISLKRVISQPYVSISIDTGKNNLFLNFMLCFVGLGLSLFKSVWKLRKNIFKEGLPLDLGQVKTSSLFLKL